MKQYLNHTSTNTNFTLVYIDFSKKSKQINKRFYSTEINVNIKQPVNKIIHIAFSDYVNYGPNSYINIFKNNLTLGVKYSYLVKISKNNIHYTLSERQKFFLLDSTDMDEVRLDYFENYLHINLSRVLELYKKVIDGECDIITFVFSPLDNHTIKEFEIKNLDLINSRLPIKNYNKIKKDFALFDTNILNHKGILLNFNINNCEFTNNIEDLNYFSFDNVKYLNYNKYYYIKYRGKSYIIAEYIKDNIKIKQCLDKFGINLYYVEDIIKEDGGFIRKDGNFYTHFSPENEITNHQKDINFNSIYSKLKLSDKPSVNQNIGTIDLETFKHDDISLCYAIGFYTENDSKMYYIDKDNLDSYILIHNCINELLRPKYKPFTFYCHNLGGFDAPFIIKALLEFNKNVNKAERYTFNSFTRDGNIIRLTIKRRVEGKIRSITINDSLPILSMSLRSLCQAYKVEQAKSYYPYNFVNKNTLFYVGNTPNKSYYTYTVKEVEDFNKFYEANYSKTWSLHEETLHYLMLDLKSLYEVIKIVNLQLFLLFDIQMTESSTISGIAMRIFLNKFYTNTDKLPLINSKQIYNDIYKSYYGGRVEVFIPKPINNEKLYYYDVNSLYPYASLNDLPGLNWSYNEFIHKPNLEDLFGFYYCKVESNNHYLGLLPHRNEKGGLSFPKGKWYGWYFSEELKLAEKYGYKFVVKKGYTTDKSKNVFKEFVNSIYQVKLKPRNNAEKNVAKLILNSLIGRFGMNPDKLVTKLLNNKEHLTICSTRVLKNSIILDDDNYLDTFSTDINKDVCEEFGLDYTKVLNSQNFHIEKAKPISNNTISISTAAAILSYSRIYMAETMQMILNKGGRIYYTDTDSIVTNIKLPDSLIDSKELGKFKLEHEVVEAYFISDKTYLIKNMEGKVIKKAKSVKEDSLDIKDYIRFYNMEVYESAIKTTAKRDYTRGSVNIDSKKVTLNIDKYTKRDRVFINKCWVNSKPIWINKVDLDLDTYKSTFSLILYTKEVNKSLILYTKVVNKSLILYANNLNKSLILRDISTNICLRFDSILKLNRNCNSDRNCKLNSEFNLTNNSKLLGENSSIRKPFNVKIKTETTSIFSMYKTNLLVIIYRLKISIVTIITYGISSLKYLVSSCYEFVNSIIKLKINNFISYIVGNIKGIFINNYAFILFMSSIILSIIVIDFIYKSLDFMSEYLDFNNFSLKDEFHTFIKNNSETISTYKDFISEKFNLLRGEGTSSSTPKNNVYWRSPNLRPIHLSLFDLDKCISPYIDFSQSESLSTIKNSYLKGYFTIESPKEEVHTHIENLKDLIKYSTREVLNFDYVNKDFINFRANVYKQQYLEYLYNDIWHNIVSHNISNRYSFTNIESIKSFSLDYLIEKNKNSPIKLSTMDFLHVFNHITNFTTTLGETGAQTGWGKFKLINFLSTESYIDLYHNSNTSLINPSRPKDHVLTFINNNSVISNLTYSFSNNITNSTFNVNNLQIPSFTTSMNDPYSPLLDVSPLTTDNKFDFNSSVITNQAKDIIKWRNDTWAQALSIK